MNEKQVKESGCRCFLPAPGNFGNLLAARTATTSAAELAEIFPDTPKVLLYRGTGFFDAAVRWQTDGSVAHAAFWFPSDRKEISAPCGIIYEVVANGVIHRPALRADFTGSNAAEIYDVIGMDALRWLYAQNFLDNQVGKPYDYLGLLRFLTRDRADYPGTWFCSELVFAALKYSGCTVLQRVKACKVSPEALRRSPFLSRGRINLP